MVNRNIEIKNILRIVLIALTVRVSLFFLTFLIKPASGLSYFDIWIHWDASHYIDIAKNWYQTNGDLANFIVFYPSYPVLIKIVNYLFGNFHLSAVLTSFILSIFASILLYKLVILDFDNRTAYLSVWFMNIFPTAYFLQAPYTESLFLTTSLLTIYLYRKASFLQAGLSGVITSLTRVNGVLLVPVLLMETKNIKKGLITLLLTPLGFLIYLLINYLTFGEPFYFSKILSSHWYKYFTWPWISIQNLINFYQNQTGDYYWLFLAEALSIILLFIFTVFVYFKIRKSYGIYMLCNLILFTSTGFIMSTPRYAIILFPVYICLASIKNRLFLFLVSIIFLMLLFILTYLYIQGKWAY